MTLSEGEKLILAMLCEIHAKLAVKDGIDPSFVKSALYSGNYWGLQWQYGGIFDVEPKNRETVTEVANILDMWWMLELTNEKLSEAEKKKIVDSGVPFASNLKFRGFDGNNEVAHLSIARFLIDDLGRFTQFKGRGDLNSHMPVLESYLRMYKTFEPKRRLLADRNLTVDEVIEILQAARAHR